MCLAIVNMRSKQRLIKCSRQQKGRLHVNRYVAGVAPGCILFPWLSLIMANNRIIMGDNRTPLMTFDLLKLLLKIEAIHVVVNSKALQLLILTPCHFS